ncbi:MAG: sigma-70 family RNA polymerase sigma factor [Planctomycetota bacterium]
MNDRALDRLFRRFRDRHDGAALAAVFDATSRELFEVACHLIRDPVEAEDLVQATFLAAIRHSGDYDGSSPLKGWLYGILWREGAKVRRSAAHRTDPHRLADVARHDARREPEPIEGLLAREVPAAVDRALEKLPQRYREVLDPLIREGRPPEDIANALQRSPGTVRSQIHRGMERLRRVLPDDFVPVSGVVGFSIRGLAKVRGEVLQAAGFSPAAAAGASVLALNATIGGLVMSKGALIAGAAAVSVAAVAWFARDGSSAGGRAPLEASAPRADTVASTDSSKSAASPAPLAEVDPASSRAGLEVSGGNSAVPVSLQDEIDRWLARFNEAPNDWRHGWDVAGEIAELPPNRALAIMTAVWPRLSVPVREQALKPFVFGSGHPHALKLLDLAASDASLSVQGRAFTYLKAYAFQDFAQDYEAYLAWAQTYRDMPLADALTQNATRFVADLRALPPEQLAERIRTLERLDLDTGKPLGVDLAAVMREAGGLEALSICLEGEDTEAKRRALEWSKSMQADETWLRTWVMPSIENPEGIDATIVDAGFHALARPDCKWAEESILEHLRRASTIERIDPGQASLETGGGMDPSGATRAGAQPLAGTRSAASALAEIGDPAAIPALIEILVHDRSGRMNYDVGYFGLAKLTGVKWQESCDGAWWLDWWEKNLRRLPPEVQAIPIRR